MVAKLKLKCFSVGLRSNWSVQPLARTGTKLSKTTRPGSVLVLAMIVGQRRENRTYWGEMKSGRNPPFSGLRPNGGHLSC